MKGIVAFLLILTCNAQAKNATLYLLKDAVKTDGAMCLDGSPTGYYLREGTGDGADKWILYLEGGGWCNDTQQCYQRSLTYLGSSKSWPKSASLPGFLSDNSTINPDFHNWNMVYVMYCDGASFAGYLVKPVMYNNKPLYYRGRVNLKASLDDLLRKGMNKATDVILTGCSAGALAVFLHADTVGSYLPKTVKKYKAFPDAGFFLDTYNIHGQRAFRMEMQNLFKAHNASAGVNQDCIDTIPVEDAWECMFAPFSYPFIKTPLFVLNSMYDTAQLKGILDLPCLPPNCSDEYLDDLYKYGQEFLKEADPVLNALFSNGYFLDSCLIHCHALGDDLWSTFTIGDSSLRETFAHWYNEDGGRTYRRDCEIPYNCNPSCTAHDQIRTPVNPLTELSGLDIWAN